MAIPAELVQVQEKLNSSSFWGEIILSGRHNFDETIKIIRAEVNQSSNSIVQFATTVAHASSLANQAHSGAIELGDQPLITSSNELRIQINLLSFPISRYPTIIQSALDDARIKLKRAIEMLEQTKKLFAKAKECRQKIEALDAALASAAQRILDNGNEGFMRTFSTIQRDRASVFFDRLVQSRKYEEIDTRIASLALRTRQLLEQIENSEETYTEERSEGVLLETDYKTMGLSPAAPNDEVKRRFLRMAKALHPDKPGGDHNKFIQMKDAYDRIISSRGM